MSAATGRSLEVFQPWTRAARRLAWLALAATPAWAGPFDTGASAMQSQVLTVLTPIAVIAVMAMGVAAWVGRITWTWAVSGIIGTVLVFGSPQVVGWVRGMFGV